MTKHSSQSTYRIFLFKVLLALVALTLFTLYMSSKTSATQATCPKGSYDIGISDKTGGPICKLEPTGCPYGDSIPFGPDCDKHKPVEVQPTPVVEEPIVEYQTFQGK